MSQSTTSAPSTPVPPARSFVEDHGPSEGWDAVTCDLYVELHSPPSPRRDAK